MSETKTKKKFYEKPDVVKREKIGAVVAGRLISGNPA